LKIWWEDRKEADAIIKMLDQPIMERLLPLDAQVHKAINRFHSKGQLKLDFLFLAT
jgi:hypothetical protein